MAGGGKVSPRQKMINMMYLVLTAMLALNVSAEVLDAFVKMEEGLGHTVKISTDKNIKAVQEFEEARAELGEEKVKDWPEKAKEVRDKTQALVDYIQNLKVTLIKRADGPDAVAIKDGQIIPEEIKAKDKTDVGAEYLIRADRKGKAYELKKEVESYKQFLFGMIADIDKGDALKKEIDEILSFRINSPKKNELRDWEQFTFEGTPLIATIAILTKMQVDALNTESSVEVVLRNQIGKTDFRISDIMAAVNNPKAVIFKGGSSKAEVFLVAYDASMQSRVKVGGREIPVNGGKAEVSFSGNSLGMQVLKGDILFQGPEGKEESRPFSIEYQVIEPSLVVSAEKMNVLYADIDNPLEISFSGVDLNKATVQSSNGAITVNGNVRSVKPVNLGTCKISVSAVVDGVNHSVNKEFVVKKVPTPTPSVFGIKGKTVSRSDLYQSQGVIAAMPEDFVFTGLTFKVTGFTVSVVQDGFLREESSTSTYFTEKQKNLIKNSKSNKVIFSEIKAAGPGGVRELNDMIYTVK